MYSTLNEQIVKIVEERYLHPGPFEEFVSQLQNLQVIRQTYDVVSDELFFYSEDNLLLHFPVVNLKGYSRSQPFTMAEEFNPHILEKALEDFDSGQISVAEFHKQLASTGIVYVSVHIPSHKIIYLSQDGQTYFESF